MIEQLEAGTKSPRRLIQEFWIPLSHERIDIVEVDGLIAGFEIKSGRDTLKRLARQVDGFSGLFDEVTVVCDPKHALAVQSLVPDWWGMVMARDGGSHGIALSSIRHTSSNPSPQVEPRLRLLWRAELIAALRSLGVDGRSMDRAEMRKALMTIADESSLNRIVRSALIRRPADAGRW